MREPWSQRRNFGLFGRGGGEESLRFCGDVVLADLGDGPAPFIEGVAGDSEDEEGFEARGIAGEGEGVGDVGGKFKAVNIIRVEVTGHVEEHGRQGARPDGVAIGHTEGLIEPVVVEVVGDGAVVVNHLLLEGSDREQAALGAGIVDDDNVNRYFPLDVNS